MFQSTFKVTTKLTDSEGVTHFTLENPSSTVKVEFPPHQMSSNDATVSALEIGDTLTATFTQNVIGPG